MSRKLDAAKALHLYATKDTTFYGIDVSPHSIRVVQRLLELHPKDEQLAVVGMLHHLDRHRIEHTDVDKRFGARETTALMRLSARDLPARAFWYAMGQTDDALARVVAGACIDDVVSRTGRGELEPLTERTVAEMRSVYLEGVASRSAD